jgi:hypothetical protein
MACSGADARRPETVLPPDEDDVLDALFEAVDGPVQRACVALASGRRYELASDDDGDRLTVRSPGGAVLLELEMGERGPRLRFTEAEVELSAKRSLTLSAPRLSLHASEELAVECAGDVRERVAGDRHTRVRGHERLEAAAIELQASERAVRVRAMEAIRLDGEHIGLNDDPAPAPFAWSALAQEGEHGHG